MELIIEDLHLGQTREGGGLGILPEQVHDFIVLLRHAQKAMADISIESNEANVRLGLEAAQAVDARAHPLGDVREVSWATWNVFGVPSDQY